MNLPKTVKGYISMFIQIEAWQSTDLKGFDKLSEELQRMITNFDAVISNEFNEIHEKHNQEKKERKWRNSIFTSR